jgi:two-component system sensor histidine kinase BaeS
VRRWTPTAARDWRVQIAARGTIRADPGRLETALDGLLENAVTATDEGDTIEVSCRAAGDDLVIELADEGRGIAAEDLPRIFDRFARVEADRGRSNGGTGLGLSITKAIVEAHGGSISAVSDGGRGATFRIMLGGFRADPSVPVVLPDVALSE